MQWNSDQSPQKGACYTLFYHVLLISKTTAIHHEIRMCLVVYSNWAFHGEMKIVSSRLWHWRNWAHAAAACSLGVNRQKYQMMTIKGAQSPPKTHRSFGRKETIPSWVRIPKVFFGSSSSHCSTVGTWFDGIISHHWLAVDAPTNLKCFAVEAAKSPFVALK